jgi:inorganic pyrophosphatase
MGISMNYDSEFWVLLNKLVSENEIIIDRPKGTRHPKYNNIIYELDYGYIKNTAAMDGNEIDVFKGSLNSKNVCTIICTVDLLKKDIEIKILLGCTVIEKKKVYEFLNNSDFMKAIIIEKEINIDNAIKEIIPISKELGFNEIYEVFEDMVFEPTKDKITNILLEYEQNNEKTLYCYLLNKKLVGIIGIIENVDNIEVLHFGIHTEYRGKNLGSELMNYIKNKGKTIKLSTDEDAIGFYVKYGFKYNENYIEKYQRIRYNCTYENNAGKGQTIA